MPQHQSKPQRETIKRVMHEYKHGELEASRSGKRVKNPKQAIAIALHESGSTNQESPRRNQKNLQRTKAKEHQGQTAQAEKEGKRAQDKTMKSAATRRPDGETKESLYAKAQQRRIAGRSKMSKRELQQALRHQ